MTVVGSLDELSERAGSSPLTDPHRPYVDDIAVQCECGEPSARTPELVAPWFEAAAMPFATGHEPFAGELTLDELYPADLGCAPPGRPRTWSSSLRRMSALLRGDAEAFEHLVDAPCHGTAGPKSADAQRWGAVTGDPGGEELVARLMSACGLASSSARGAPTPARRTSTASSDRG